MSELDTAPAALLINWPFPAAPQLEEADRGFINRPEQWLVQNFCVDGCHSWQQLGDTPVGPHHLLHPLL